MINRIKELFEQKKRKYLIYSFIVMFLALLFWSINTNFLFINYVNQFVVKVGQFLKETETKTLDLRFQLPDRNLKVNKDVVILGIDDDSFELLYNDYGKYPWTRDIYVKAINYLEADGVDSIAFDLMFNDFQKGFENKDKELIKTIIKNKNVYVSMNFDNRKKENTPNLPDLLKYKLENNSYDIEYNEYTNCNLIFKDIIKSSPNIGIINFFRDPDSVSRRTQLFFNYKNDYYPYLAFRVAYDYLKRHEHIKMDKFVIDKNNQLIIGKRKIPLDQDGAMLINWYKPVNPDEHVHTFINIPFYKVIKSADLVKHHKKPLLDPGYFKNKIVLVGISALAQYDIKTTPLNSVYPGVEIQANILNNILDDNPVRKVDLGVDAAICIILSLIIGLLVFKTRSSLVSSIMTIIITVFYIVFASFIFEKYFIWVGIVNQIIVIMITFTTMYIIKYLIKSKDFEYTYKLATTDGLTNLYNHRFFQERMTSSIEKSLKQKSHFSLILIDIDFFKKFNDTYGHQAGDAVLRQVADTLKKTVRPCDIVARYGGEEMAIILDNMDIDEAIKVADKICKIIANKSFRLSELIETHVTISLGVSTYPQHGLSPTELIEVSDKGLYRAKNDGRNQVGKLTDNNFMPTDNPDPSLS